jgi:hypothetical protein
MLKEEIGVDAEESIREVSKRQQDAMGIQGRRQKKPPAFPALCGQKRQGW